MITTLFVFSLFFSLLLPERLLSSMDRAYKSSSGSQQSSRKRQRDEGVLELSEMSNATQVAMMGCENQNRVVGQRLKLFGYCDLEEIKPHPHKSLSCHCGNIINSQWRCLRQAFYEAVNHRREQFLQARGVRLRQQDNKIIEINLDLGIVDIGEPCLSKRPDMLSFYTQTQGRYELIISGTDSELVEKYQSSMMVNKSESLLATLREAFISLGAMRTVLSSAEEGIHCDVLEKTALDKGYLLEGLGKQWFKSAVDLLLCAELYDKAIKSTMSKQFEWNRIISIMNDRNFVDVLQRSVVTPSNYIKNILAVAQQDYEFRRNYDSVTACWVRSIVSRHYMTEQERKTRDQAREAEGLKPGYSCQPTPKEIRAYEEECFGK